MTEETTVKWILISYLSVLAYSQTPPTENVVINQSTDGLLKCSVADCANVQWNSVNMDDSVTLIGMGLNIYPDYQKYYALNTTAGYCTLIVIQATVDTTSGHINCIDTRSGKSAKSFNIYVISDGPRCSAGVQSSDGYATDGETLTYQCLMTYGGGGTNGYVDMTWLNEQGQTQTGSSRSTAQNQISSRFDVVAGKPSVPQYTCRSSFGNKNVSTATIISRDCIVNAVLVKYPVSHVTLSRQGLNFVPSTNITCTADGVPPPTYRWVDSTTGLLYTSGQVLVVTQASTDQYHCEAYNSLNTLAIKSASIMFNNSVNPDEIVTSAGTPAWVIPVVICIPLTIILIIIIVCLVWPRCPLSRAIRNRRASRNMKDKTSHRSDDVDTSAPITNLDLSLNSSENHPDIVPKPRPKPRSSVSSGKSSLDRPTQPPPPPKKPAQSRAGAANESAELLYADINPAPRPEASKRTRPPRPQPSHQPENIYTPVIRS